MYKKRLGDWKSRKYYTQALKKKVISRLAIAGLENQSATPVELNGKPIKLQRLYRRVQRQGECFSIASHPDHAVRRAMKRYRASIQETRQIGRHILQQSAQSRDIEQFLRIAHRYYTWYTTQTECEYQLNSCVSLINFVRDMEAALGLLETNSATAFACLNRSCAEINSILRQQPFQFLYWLVYASSFCEKDLRASSQMWRSVLKFIASLSFQVLGISHPVTECVNLMSSNNERDYCISLRTSFSQLLIDIVQAMPASSERSELLSDLALAGHNNNNQLAERILESLEIARSRSTQPTKAHRNVLRTAIKASYSRDEYTTCEELCRKQIEWSTEIAGRPEGDLQGAFACEDLGHVCSLTNRADESERFYRMSLKGYVTQLYHGDALKILRYLEEDLKAREKHEEAAELREEYDHLLAEFEKWKLGPAQFAP
jgi:hypothetical protein